MRVQLKGENLHIFLDEKVFTDEPTNRIKGIVLHYAKESSSNTGFLDEVVMKAVMEILESTQKHIDKGGFNV